MSGGPLSVVYLLEDTPLFGGVKVVLEQADLLARRGHDVTIVSPGTKPDWHSLAAAFRRAPGLDPEHLPEADVVVATYWTTITRAQAALDAGVARSAVHYCQGFEALYTHNQIDHQAILEAYDCGLPALAVAPHLARMLAERFGRPAQVVPQPLDPAFRPRWRLRPQRPPRILVTSPFEIDWKGVATALRAVVELRESGFECELWRLSQWPLGDDERQIIEADRFHHHLPPSAVPALFRDVDLLLAASWEQEGFGLPVLEALASGVPVVASDISAFGDFAAPAAVLVPAHEPSAFAEAARSVLEDSVRWRAMRRAGRDVARGYRPAISARAAEDALHWVASGAWRKEVEAGA